MSKVSLFDILDGQTFVLVSIFFYCSYLCVILINYSAFYNV